MPYAPLGFQSPLPYDPNRPQSPWMPDRAGPPLPPEQYGPPGLGEQALAMGRQMHEQIPNFDPVQALLQSPLPMQAFAMAPRLAAGAYGAAGPLLISDRAHGAEGPSEAVKKMQEELRDAGYYKGPIDGLMKKGTSDAKAAFERDKAAAGAQKARETELELQRGKQAEEAKAGEAARTAEAQRLKLEGARAEEHAAGQKKMALPEYSNPTWMEQWGPYAGFGLGTLMGGGERVGMGKGVQAREQAIANRADRLTGEVGQGSPEQRMSRVNQFYTEGGRGTEQPFTETPGTKPYAYTPNPAAPQASELYRRGPGYNYGPGLGVAATGGAEIGLGMHYGAQAHKELQDAQKAVEDHASETNIQRLLAARRSVAQWEFVTRMGQGTLTGGALGELGSRMKGAPPRPDMGPMGGERAELNKLFGAPPALPPAPLSPAPVPGMGGPPVRPQLPPPASPQSLRAQSQPRGNPGNAGQFRKRPDEPSDAE